MIKLYFCVLLFT